MEDAGMLEKVEEGRGEHGRTTKKRDIAPVYVSTLQTFETCGYFDASYKRRYPTREKPHKLITLSDNRTIKIIPTQEYGYANAVDLDYQRALFRIIDEQAEMRERTNSDGTKSFHPHVSQPIRAQVKPFIRYAGRYPKPRERKYLDDFLHRNRATSMHGTFEDPKTRMFRQFDVALFSQILTRGEKTKNDTIADTYLIWLTDYALRLYYWHRTRPEDITFHYLLTKPIGKVLYPYLDSGWFASLTKGGKAYTKSYPTLCNFLSLTCYIPESKIKEQLDPAHEELQQLGYLDRWEYRPRENKEWVVTWYPGWKWFEDAKARGSDFTPKVLPKAEPQQLPLAPQPTTSTEAQALARYFYKLFHGIEHATPTAKELASAQDLIATHGLAHARYVVEFSRRVAPETNYNPQNFAGILSYTARAIADYDQGKEREQKRTAIAACSLCDNRGMFAVEDARGISTVVPCPHDAEKRLEYAAGRLIVAP